ncbi:filamentous hemagglutinin N-terminal domain-containing protein [Pseudorhodobacter sp. E13]|uniref:filamentous hemagglutinin N-terminal domain-containing protein n=1 Tax=Pseudorhodobacter sp. E13 TaxID=2487931 RepID=UPI00131510BB|nr:filamentous hemagglutinin N-terminal domain-containing protein [Pseudorhodobacter sp. E13]
MAVLFSFSPASLVAQIVSDGSTNTNVVVNADGSVTVGIAPTTSDGVSLNRYRDFSVPKPGVQLDNRTEAARTIVNEVTGTSRTDIEGPVEVLGQRAHVIVANPNGIVIDGGRFVNTGRVALTTGQISTTQRQIAPGIFQDNLVSTVNGGTITVKGGGLSGQMDAIDLIAHSIRVDGPITNESTNAGASIRLAAGSSSTEFDSAVLPGNTGLSWGNITGAGATSEGAVLVEITRPGVLRANRVGIEVSDQGAGVRFAGEGYATARSFTLSADGRIDLSGAKIEAPAGISASARSITLDNSTLTASEGPISMAATEATGDGLTGLDFALSGQTLFLSSEGNLSFGITEDGTTSLTSTTGDIVLQAKGTFADAGSSFAAHRNLLVSADQRLSLSESTLGTTEGSIQLDTKGAFTATGTVANAFGHLLVTADEATLAKGTRRSEFKAENGSFILTTFGVNSAGHLTNTGSLIQGGVQVDGLKDSAETESTGAVTLNVKGSLINTTAEDLAVIFGAGGDVSIRTGVNIENNRGRILANGDVKLIAEGDVLNIVDAPNGAVDPEVVQYTRKGKRQWWTLWIKRKRESYVSYDYGTLENTDQLAAITATDGVSIEASGSLINQGGDINANDGDLEIKALRVETIGLGSGKVYVRRTCVLTCSYDGEGSVAYFGGRLNASENVRIEATEKFYNRAGSVLAIGNVEIISGDVELEAALVPTLVTRPAGLYNFWASKAAWVFLRDQFGSIVADTGNITVTSDRPAKITGGTLTAGGSVELENGQEIVRAPDAYSDAPNHTIGFFADLPLIRQ